MAKKPKQVKFGDTISAAEWNALKKLASREVTGPRVITTPNGWHIRDAPHQETDGVDNIQFVVVKEIDQPNDRAIKVKRVKPTIEDGQWTGGFHAVGDLVEMPVYPFQRARDFEAFIWPDDSLTDETCVLPAINVGGDWYVMQYLRHRLAPPNTRIPITDCAVSMIE